MICRCSPLRRWSVALAVVMFLSGGLTPVALAERPSAPRLLPQTTLAVVSVTDVPDLVERFRNTATGKMLRDPQLKPLVDQLYGSLLEATDQLKDRIGLSLSELLAIPQGEITVALVAVEEREPAILALIDVGDQLPNAQKLLKRGTDELERSNAAKSEQTVSGTKMVIYDGVGPRRRKIAYFEKDGTFVLSSDVDVLKQVLTVWNGGEGEVLAGNPRFAAVMQRCRDSAAQHPQVALYADPIGIVHAVGQRNTGAQVALAILPVLGVDGLKAVGGTLFLDTAQFDSVAHAHVLLDSPRAGVLKMIALEPGDVTPERWVPPDVAAYITVNWDVQKTFDTLSTVFDSFRGEGALAKALERRILGPTGIDFEKEVIRSLAGRITMVTWIERPVTMQSQRMMLGLKVKDAAAVEGALEKIFKLKELPLVRETFAGKQYYQVRIPQLEELPAERRPPLPCFGVLDDTLLVANGPSLYRQAVTTWTDGSRSLADELDFKLIASKIRRRSGGNKPAMIVFERPEEGMRFLYELATSERTRQQLREQSENNRFFKTLDTALKDNPLPPFEVLLQYLAPTGAMVVDDETGIHYTAFGMRRQ